MGKLRTTGRLVTRDNEEQEASEWLLERDSASYEQALVAIPVGQAESEASFEEDCVRGHGREARQRSIVAAAIRFEERRKQDLSVTIETVAVAEFYPNRSENDREYRSRGKRSFRRRSVWHALPGTEQLSLPFEIIVAIVAMVTVLCVPIASAVPMPSRENQSSLTDGWHDLEYVHRDFFDRSSPRSILDETEMDIIRRSIARGLGLERIPDPAKANVSQAEYERAHREYLMRIQLSVDEQSYGTVKKLHVFSGTAYPGKQSSRSSERRHWLFFPVEIPREDKNASVDHATVRLLLHSPAGEDYTERSELDALLYLRAFDRSRKLIGRQRVELQDSGNSRWLEFDATLAVSLWLEAALENFGLEVVFLLDGEPVRRTFSSPVLNVFTATSSASATGKRRTKRSSPEELMSLHKGRRTKCKGDSKKCCRHELTVMFKDLKGFEFIVYPKTFDAGYCKGRCPPRYNPAHHHALLQSLLWKEDRKKVPKPCCAPSKLDQLMIVYFDENDSTQLKVSFWKNIQVLECACS
ncbi:TGF-beta domain-containing family member maverick [Xylocopa sonorina]|uniref:TGF-beta domain-containing family member maverick n=1 Tax=Xylocopa sonorina TaxID=1818115 RepID=UPI00403AF797